MGFMICRSLEIQPAAKLERKTLDESLASTASSCGSNCTSKLFIQIYDHNHTNTTTVQHFPRSNKNRLLFSSVWEGC